MLPIRCCLRAPSLHICIGTVTFILCAALSLNETWARNLSPVKAVNSQLSKDEDTSIPPVHKRLSEVECRTSQCTCYIRNLYRIGGHYHVFLSPKNPIFQEPSWWNGSIAMTTGIGFGSPVFRFLADCTEVDWRSAAANATRSWQEQMMGMPELDKFPNGPPWIHPYPHCDLNNPDPPGFLPPSNRTPFFPIYLHREQPPSTLPYDALYYRQPVLFMSVLWDNLFRTIYAGVAGWYTLMDYNMFFPMHQRIMLVDPKGPKKFLPLLQYVTQKPLIMFEDPREQNSLYQSAIIGLSKDANVAELEVERVEEARFHLRKIAFTSFCSTLRNRLIQLRSSTASHLGYLETQSSNAPAEAENPPSIPKLLLLRRAGGTRAIINEDALILHLQKLPVTVDVQAFEHLNLQDQVSHITSSDILVATHGAGLAHVLFMRPGTHVVEIFPYNFRKTIFRNLCRIMGVHYVFFQNSRLEDARFQPGYVEGHRFTNADMDTVLNQPIDWTNMDSKNFWRNQDIRVSLPQLDRLLEITLRRMKSSNGDDKYLMMMPWEQFNNQVTGFKSACALAKMTDRTVVLPHLGWRYKLAPSPGQNEMNGGKKPLAVLFRPLDFVWEPFEKYFDARALSTLLPCRYISMDNFLALNAGKSLGTVRYHSLGEGTTLEQIVEYYRDVVAEPFDGVVEDYNTYYQLTINEILKRHGQDSSRVLALGSMFWYYDFGVKQKYPLTTMYEFLRPTEGSGAKQRSSDPIYREITEALQYRPEISQLAGRCLERLALQHGLGMPSKASPSLTSPSSTLQRLVCIHARQGDYEAKCQPLAVNGGEANAGLVKSCWQDPLDILDKLKGDFPVFQYPVVFVATDQFGDGARARRFRRTLKKVFRCGDCGGSRDVTSDNNSALVETEGRTVLFQNDILGLLPTWVTSTLDVNERSILEQLVCSRSGGFVGNLHSSWTRRVVEMRVMAGRSWSVF